MNQRSEMGRTVHALNGEPAVLSVLPSSAVFVRHAHDGLPLTLDMLLPEGATMGSVEPAVLADVNAAIQACNSSIEARLTVTTPHGVHVVCVTAQAAGHPPASRWLIAVRDVTKELDLEEDLRRSKAALRALNFGQCYSTAETLHLALHDPLTELPNRRAFDNALAEACTIGPFALCLLDMDEFKKVNDSLGHTAGDNLLKAVGERLRKHTRADDFVARLGGDEFAVILHDVATEDDAREAASRLLARFEHRLDVGDVALKASLTAGVVLGGESAEPHAVYRAADMALHAGKSNQRGLVSLGAETGVLGEHDDLVIAKSILSSGNVPINFDPIFDAHGAVLGHEAVVGARQGIRRWTFDPILRTATKFGLGHELIECVLRAITHAAVNAAIPSLHIRLPAVAFTEAAMVDTVARGVLASPIEAKSAFVEVPLQLPDGVAADVTDTLHRAGLNIILDEWDLGVRGYGFAATGRVRGVKLNASTVGPLTTDMAGQAFLAAGLGSVTALGLPLFAHRVDTTQTAALLFRMGVVGAQGEAFATTPGQRKVMSAA